MAERLFGQLLFTEFSQLSVNDNFKMFLLKLQNRIIKIQQMRVNDFWLFLGHSIRSIPGSKLVLVQF